MGLRWKGAIYIITSPVRLLAVPDDVAVGTANLTARTFAFEGGPARVTVGQLNQGAAGAEIGLTLTMVVYAAFTIGGAVDVIPLKNASVIEAAIHATVLLRLEPSQLFSDSALAVSG